MLYLLLLIVLLGAHISLETSSVDMDHHCYGTLFIVVGIACILLVLNLFLCLELMFNSTSTPGQDIFTNIIEAEEGTELSFICGGCCTPRYQQYCWHAEDTYIGEEHEPTLSVVGLNPDQNGLCRGSKLTYNVTSKKPFGNLKAAISFVCVKSSNCSGSLLPICFNYTVSRVVTVKRHYPAGTYILYKNNVISGHTNVGMQAIVRG